MKDATEAENAECLFHASRLQSRATISTVFVAKYSGLFCASFSHALDTTTRKVRNQVSRHKLGSIYNTLS